MRHFTSSLAAQREPSTRQLESCLAALDGAKAEGPTDLRLCSANSPSRLTSLARVDPRFARGLRFLYRCSTVPVLTRATPVS